MYGDMNEYTHTHTHPPSHIHIYLSMYMHICIHKSLIAQSTGAVEYTDCF